MVTKVYINRQEINEIVWSVAGEISKSYKDGEEILVVGILRGAYKFMHDLIDKLDVYFHRSLFIDFITANTYLNNEQKFTDHLAPEDIESIRRLNCKDRKVLLVDDVYDTGNTISIVKDMLYTMGAKDVKIAVLLEKKKEHKHEHVADFIGRKIDDVYVFGYGMDYNGKYRNYREIYIEA